MQGLQVWDPCREIPLVWAASRGTVAWTGPAGRDRRSPHGAVMGQSLAENCSPDMDGALAESHQSAAPRTHGRGRHCHPSRPGRGSVEPECTGALSFNAAYLVRF